MPDLDLDWRLRLAAFDKLSKLRDARGGLVPIAELEAGFEFEGEQIPLLNARRGIWRPRLPPRRSNAGSPRELTLSRSTPGARQVAALEKLLRIRVGDYRVVYQVFDDLVRVLVVTIRHRRDVYR